MQHGQVILMITINHFDVNIHNSNAMCTVSHCDNLIEI